VATDTHDDELLGDLQALFDDACAQAVVRPERDRAARGMISAMAADHQHPTVSWILRGESESGDEYPYLGLFDKKPSQEEVAAVLVNADCEPAVSIVEAAEGPAEPFCHNGQWYTNYVHWELVEVHD
jgi:hypothetical protein